MTPFTKGAEQEIDFISGIAMRDEKIFPIFVKSMISHDKYLKLLKLEINIDSQVSLSVIQLDQLVFIYKAPNV